MLSKSEFNSLVGKRLQSIINSMHLTQRQVLERCAEKGYSFSQSAMSKILSGTSVHPLQIAQLCEVLQLDVSEVMSLDPNTEVHYNAAASLPSTPQLITDATNIAFRAYMGKFHAYFYTTKNEESIHHGIFEIGEDPQTHKCTASFQFKTGEKDIEGNDIEKHYTGTVTCSNNMHTFYCSLMSEEIGEISFLLFHYDFLAYQLLESRLASVITVSSGIKRLPTMHRLLLTRKELTNEELDCLRGQLKLNHSEIFISENAYRGLLQDPALPESFFKYFGGQETSAEGFISAAAKVPFYMINESLISDSFLSEEDKIKIICLLRKYSSAPRCAKISAKADEHIYKFLQFQKKKVAEADESITES